MNQVTLVKVYRTTDYFTRSVCRAELVHEFEIEDDEEVLASDYGGDFLQFEDADG